MEGAAIVGLVVTVVIGLNIMLASLQAGLAKLKDLTETKVDNKIYDFLAAWLPFLQKLADVLSANVAHQPKK